MGFRCLICRDMVTAEENFVTLVLTGNNGLYMFHEKCLGAERVLPCRGACSFAMK